MTGQTSGELLALRLAVMSVEETLGGHHPATARAMARLGAAAHHAGNVVEAERRYRRALSILQTQPTPDRTTIGRLLTDLGELLLDSGRIDDAEGAMRRADALLADTRP